MAKFTRRVLLSSTDRILISIDNIRKWDRILIRNALSTMLLLSATLSSADAPKLDLGPMPISLKHLPIPEVPGLLNGPDPIVTDKAAAIALGKALFWDVNVGSDGMACASCHFHAGADSRSKNQLAPGGQSSAPTTSAFGLSLVGNMLSPNHQLSLRDFPLHQRQNPFEESSPVIYDTTQVVGSAGTFGGEYTATAPMGSSVDECIRQPDTSFHVGLIGTRKVTHRNAPSVINTIFNHRSFWDGRANNVFNGSSPWGDRDPDAGVWVKVGPHNVIKQRLHLINASLASLATAPPSNTSEMSCAQRSLKEIGRKLLPRHPLEHQNVHWQDSVLGKLSLSTSGNLQKGLNTTYASLIRQAYNSKYWSSSDLGQFSTPIGERAYSQIEANFALFFGLAIQLYESTLISDESPFDNSARDAQYQPINLSPAELRGLEQFRANLCSHCHLGPNFSAASVNANAALFKTHPEAFSDASLTISTTYNVVDRIPLVASEAFYDTGFASTGVAQESADLGLGANDDFGNPLSFSQQYLQFLAGRPQKVVDNEVFEVRPCDFQIEFALNYQPPYSTVSLFTPIDGVKPQLQSTDNCHLPPATSAFLPTTEAALRELNNPNSKKMLAGVMANFKIPSLRNVELTGPYMHNGGMATLDQVIEFYTRGGNFAHASKQVTRVFGLPNLHFSEQNRSDLIAFLKTLTDERVRYQRAPFDHPEIYVPYGHEGDTYHVNSYATYPDFGKDELLLIPAVGAEGSNEPLLPFQNYLTP